MFDKQMRCQMSFTIESLVTVRTGISSDFGMALPQMISHGVLMVEDCVAQLTLNRIALVMDS